MSNHTGLSPQTPLQYVGPNVYLAVVVTRNRAPTGADYRQPETGKLYPFNSFWLVGKDPTTGVQGDMWYLSKIVANVAYWVKLSASAAGPLIAFLGGTNTTGFPVTGVVPNGGGFVTIDTDTNLQIDGSTPNTLTFSLAGGHGIDHIVTDTGGAGLSGATINLNSSTLFATGTNARALAVTNSSATQGNISLQLAGSNASTATANNFGVAQFDSTQFTVTSGFVKLVATGGGIGKVIRQVFTGNGTYTPSAGMIYADIEVVGGGGGSGGGATCDSSHFALSGGGGGGGYARKVVTAATIGASQAVTVGAGGTAGTAGNNAGGTGGTTSVGAILSATGGTGGAGGAAVSASTSNFASSSSAGGSGSSGDFNTTGTPSTCGQWVAQTLTDYGFTSAGGSSFFGGGAGGTSFNAAQVTAIAGTSYGGGSAGVNNFNAAAIAGAAGAPGIVIVTEYTS